jgi:hypothetical protein
VAYGALQSQSQLHAASSGMTDDMRVQKEPFYIEYVRKDLPKLVDLVVPEGREGLANLMSTTQVGSILHIAHSGVNGPSDPTKLEN